MSELEDIWHKPVDDTIERHRSGPITRFEMRSRFWYTTEKSNLRQTENSR